MIRKVSGVLDQSRQVVEECQIQKANAWALLVLDGRVDDSLKTKQLATTLREKYSFPPENVRVLNAEKATLSEIVAALQDLLNCVNNESTVVVHCDDEKIIEDDRVYELLTHLEEKSNRCIW